MEFRTYETWSFPTSVQDVVDFAVTFNGHSQPVIHDYPWSLPGIAIVLYLIMVHYLPSVMAKREAFDLRWALKIWNFLLVVLSVFIFWCASPSSHSRPDPSGARDLPSAPSGAGATH